MIFAMRRIVALNALYTFTAELQEAITVPPGSFLAFLILPTIASMPAAAAVLNSTLPEELAMMFEDKSGNAVGNGTEQDLVTIHTYYRQHDVYKIPRAAWERKLAVCGGDVDAAIQSFIDWGVDPIDGDTTEFYAEVEVK
jgi:hypothetical protein